MSRNHCSLVTYRLHVLLVLPALLSPALSSAQDASKASQAHWSVGVKVWPNEWESWVTSPKGTGVVLGTERFQTVEAVGSSNQVSVIPFVSYRFKDFFGSMSAMVKTNYTLRDTALRGGADVAATRQELDFNAGRSIWPGLSLTVGIKQLTQTYGSDKSQWKGPVFGVTGSAPIARGWSIYASAGIGFMRAKFPLVDADAYGKTSFNADYRLGEFGLAYAIPGSERFLKSLLVTAGYRSQYIATKDYGLAVTDTLGISMPNTTVHLKDTTQGFTLGLVGSF